MISSNAVWIGLAAGMAVLLTAEAPQACPFGTDIFVQNSGVGLLVDTPTAYDPFSGVGKRESGTIIIENASAVDCTNISLTFEDATSAGGLTASGTGDTIPFKITLSGGNAQLINDASGIFVGNIAAGTTASVDFDFVIDAAASVAGPGNPYFDDDINLVVHSSESGQPLDQSKQLRTETWVDTLLDINIGGASYIPGSLSAYTMDLGTLASGSSQSVNVTIRANVGHEIMISSENSGVMVGPAPGSIETHQVSYTISFSGSSGLGLGTPVTLPLAATKTPLAGTVSAFRVDITDIGSARSGSYKDVISLTVQGSV